VILLILLRAAVEHRVTMLGRRERSHAHALIRWIMERVNRDSVRDRETIIAYFISTGFRDEYSVYFMSLSKYNDSESLVFA
jgi:hypothetical protein